VVELFVWTLLAWVAAVMLDRRLWPTALAYAATVYLAAQSPDATYLWATVGNGCLTLNLAVVWWPGWTRPEAAGRARG